MASGGKLAAYREHHRRLLFSEPDRQKFFDELTKSVSLGEAEKVRILLDIIKRESQTRALSMYRENGGESLLHIAAKFNQRSDISMALIKLCPELMMASRKESDDYFGQTALHIAIAKGNTEAVETMLSEILNHSQTLRSTLLHQLATGDKFANTVMMGELPLSVAALTFNVNMIEVLLQNGVEMERSNTKGDTVFHTLIRFAALYPEKQTNVIQTMDYLHDKIKERLVESHGKDILSLEYDHSDYSYIWFVCNNDDLNPLQLATVLSQPAIFEYILNIPKVYCFLNNHDGLFDRKLFDITEIDTVATEKWASQQKQRRNRLHRHVAPTNAEGVSKRKFQNKTTSCLPFDICRRETRKSILEMMFDIKSSAAFEFIQLSAVRQVIKSKWMYYRMFYYSWMLFHILFMITLTAYAVTKADSYPNITSNGNSTIEHPASISRNQQNFLNVFRIFFLVIGVVYLFHQVFHLAFRVKSFELVPFLSVLHNGSYRVVLLLFSISLIIEFALDVVLKSYENYTLIVALITGWWFVVFFLRAQKKFSFFTVMIQKIIFGDMLRFSVLIALMLVAFTASIYMTFKGTNTEDLHSYGSTMMLLFKLMLGLGDIEALYEARRPWMAVTLFIVFVLLTYVLMFNALIAMMSQTCSLVSENRLVQWRVQQLSIIMFFEGILPTVMKKLVGTEKHVKRFDPGIKQIVEEQRFFLDMSSVQIEYANAEDIYSMRQKLQTLPFGDQQPFHQNFNMTIPTHHFMMSPRYNHGLFTPISMHNPHPEPTHYDPIPSPNQPGPSVNISPPADNKKPSDSPQTPKLKRRKTKREKSPSAANNSFQENSDSGDNVSPKSNKHSKKRNRRKRVEPEGDINDNQSPERNTLPLDNAHLRVPNAIPSYLVNERRRHYSENGLIDTHIGGPTHPHIGGIMPQSHISGATPQSHIGGVMPHTPVGGAAPLSHIGGVGHPSHIGGATPQAVLQVTPQQDMSTPGQNVFPIKRVQMQPMHPSQQMAAMQSQPPGALNIEVISDSYM